MRRALTAAFAATLVVASQGAGIAQIVNQPTPNPPGTAENEGWYVDRQPIPFGGRLYYPAGAQIFFNPNEMVWSGRYMGVPLYTRTTIEPYSIVYVPVGGGRMQPYERPRSGDLAGTSGSQASSLVTSYAASSPAGTAVQSAGPPTGTTPTPRTEYLPTSYDAPAPAAAESTRPVGTGGGRALPRPVRSDLPRREDVFIRYDDARWRRSGRALTVDPSMMTRVGEYHGFGVWRRSGESADVIYIPVLPGSQLMVAYVRGG